MGVMVDLIEEIRNRVETAIGSGKTLEGVKRVMVGFEAEARGSDNLPVINIALTGTETNSEYQRGSISETLTIDILLLYNKLVGTNKLFKTTGGGSGSIYVLEKLLNAIENNTSDELDLDFAGTSSRLREYRVAIDESKDVVELRITMKVGTIQFMAGAR